jgi:hypothetical protein
MGQIKITIFAQIWVQLSHQNGVATIVTSVNSSWHHVGVQSFASTSKICTWSGYNCVIKKYGVEVISIRKTTLMKFVAIYHLE